VPEKLDVAPLHHLVGVPWGGGGQIGKGILEKCNGTVETPHAP
jgi:hypothetical protein